MSEAEQFPPYFGDYCLNELLKEGILILALSFPFSPSALLILELDNASIVLFCLVISSHWLSDVLTLSSLGSKNGRA